MVTGEILRQTRLLPADAQSHGTHRHGAPYCNWVALFPPDSAPCAGFRILEECGMATMLQLRQRIKQCYRCLGFHHTRVYSRASACWNCGSIMHSEEECKASTRCRNCGGPHLSDPQDFQARTNKSNVIGYH